MILDDGLSCILHFRKPMQIFGEIQSRESLFRPIQLALVLHCCVLDFDQAAGHDPTVQIKS